MSRRKKIIWTSVSISLGLGGLCLVERVIAAPLINCSSQPASYVTKGILKTDSPTSSSNPGSPKRCTFALAPEYVEVPEHKKSGKIKKRNRRSQCAQSKKAAKVMHESKRLALPTLKLVKEVKSSQKEQTTENPFQFLCHDPSHTRQLSLLRPIIRQQPCENLEKILERLGNPLHAKHVKKLDKGVKQKLNSSTSDVASKKQILPPVTVKRSDEKAVRIK